MRKLKTFNIFFIFFCIILNFISGSGFEYAHNSPINNIMHLNLSILPSVIAGICRFKMHPGLADLSSSILQIQTAGLVSFVVAFFAFVDLIFSIRNSTERELYPKLAKIGVNLIIGTLCFVLKTNYISICVISVLILIASIPFLSRRHDCFNLIFGIMFFCAAGSEWSKLIFRIFKTNINLVYPFSLVFLVASMVGVYCLCKTDGSQRIDSRFHGIFFPIIFGLVYQIFGINMIWFMPAFFLISCIIKNYTCWSIQKRQGGVCAVDILVNLVWQLCMLYLFITFQLSLIYLFVMIIIGQISIDLIMKLIFPGNDIIDINWLGFSAC